MNQSPSFTIDAQLTITTPNIGGVTYQETRHQSIVLAFAPTPGMSLLTGIGITGWTPIKDVRIHTSNSMMIVLETVQANSDEELRAMTAKIESMGWHM